MNTSLGKRDIYCFLSRYRSRSLWRVAGGGWPSPSGHGINFCIIGYSPRLWLPHEALYRQGLSSSSNERISQPLCLSSSNLLSIAVMAFEDARHSLLDSGEGNPKPEVNVKSWPWLAACLGVLLLFPHRLDTTLVTTTYGYIFAIVLLATAVKNVTGVWQLLNKRTQGICSFLIEGADI